MKRLKYKIFTERKFDIVDVVFIFVMFTIVIVALLAFINPHGEGGITSGTLTDYKYYDDGSTVTIKQGLERTKYCINPEIEEKAQSLVGQEVRVEYEFGCKFSIDWNITTIEGLD